ncbi:centrosomal protein 20-like [Aethina tumida]|uniref:centrosomal protein 20-like n=1 Tax=Aethina tumida TaxID=116153 RepID=UPI00096AF846|nr:centrosomal protein 20-like [Aethina tumida]
MAEGNDENILNCVKNYLESDRSLGPLRGQIRDAVTSILSKNSSAFKPPEVPDEVRIVNELIREYLNWNGYYYTEKMLSKESGQTNRRLDRNELTDQLNVLDDERTVKIPIMYYIVSSFQKSIEKKPNKK